MTTTPPKKSDLGTRTLSAIVMVAVAGTALWLGNAAWGVFVAAVGLGVLWEWLKLAKAISASKFELAVWLAGGAIYIGLAAIVLSILRPANGKTYLMVLAVVGVVVATDICAYFAGRTIGGPKIAPGISPSKTWAGLAGGMLGASLFLGLLWSSTANDSHAAWLSALKYGPIAAIAAQTGDFFESWMKRRAGVKDSGRLIPGHGGLFDRVDGLLAVLFTIAVTTLGSEALGLS